MKRHENMLSSSSFRETRSEIHEAKRIGCMSGIFQFVFKYQDRRKFLTSVRKQDKSVVVSPPTKAKPSPEKKTPEKNGKDEEVFRSLGKDHSHCDFRRFSCDLPRSPTLPTEIRRSNSLKSVDNFRRPHALVARLMGLDEIPESPESAAEKRRQLLIALQKCDEDLKALKKIIEAIHSTDHIRSPAAADCSRVKGPASPGSMKQYLEREVKVRASSGNNQRFFVDTDGRDSRREKSYSDINGEQPSPVSVLDEISCAPFKRQKSGEQNKKSKEDNIGFSFHRMTVESLQRRSGCREDYGCDYSGLPTKKTDWGSPFRSSKPMIECVNKICQDVAWEEQRELGTIGLILQNDIFAELIEEIVKELGCYRVYSSLPFEACRRRLRF